MSSFTHYYFKTLNLSIYCKKNIGTYNGGKLKGVSIYKSVYHINLLILIITILCQPLDL